MARASVGAQRKNRPTRQEKAQITYQSLMHAAAAVVGRDGYAQASIAKITGEAGIAHGTFYNYFEDRQALFDALLPHVGRQMIDSITAAVADAPGGAEREVARFRAFCVYLAENPGFYRILYEAEVFAPRAHAEHIRLLVEGYQRALDRAVERGDIKGYDKDELGAVIYVLLGARAYVSMQHLSRDGGKTPEISVSESAIRAYAKLITRGLFGPTES